MTWMTPYRCQINNFYHCSSWSLKHQEHCILKFMCKNVSKPLLFNFKEFSSIHSSYFKFTFSSWVRWVIQCHRKCSGIFFKIYRWNNVMNKIYKLLELFKYLGWVREAPFSSFLKLPEMTQDFTWYILCYCVTQ